MGWVGDRSERAVPNLSCAADSAIDIATMRCFLGIGLPPGPQQILEDTLGQLRKVDAAVRWVKPENLHITLKFLGELGEEHLENLKRRLAKIDKPALELALDGLLDRRDGGKGSAALLAPRTR